MASPVPMETVRIAEESLRRCGREAFFHSFYQRLLASDPSIPLKFARTDFDNQNKLLLHGLGLLLVYAKHDNPALLDRIAERHGRNDLDIAPSLYPLFVDSLVATVHEHDPEASAEVERAWRLTLAPGIAFMTARYGRDGAGSS